MAEMNPDLREELVQLGQELYEGDITRKGYEKRLNQILSRYDVVLGESYPGDSSTADVETAYNVPPITNNSGLDAETEAQDAHLSAGVCDPIINFTESPCRPTLSHSLSGANISSPSFKQPRSALIQAFTKTEAFIREWTPFLLVSSYFIFSTCLYMLCNGELISIFWFIYLFTNFYIAGSTV
jgi:DMAP1-binding Domain